MRVDRNATAAPESSAHAGVNAVGTPFQNRAKSSKPASVRNCPPLVGLVGHATQANTTAVRPTATSRRTQAHISTLAPECGETVALHDINLNTLLPANRTTLRYNGSLTTAPFTEGVQWFLTKELTVSHETIARFQGLFTSGNARATQPLNGRVVTEVPQY